MYGQSGSGKTFSTMELLRDFIPDAIDSASSSGFHITKQNLEAIEVLASSSWDLVGRKNDTDSETKGTRAANDFLDSQGEYVDIPSIRDFDGIFTSLKRRTASTKRNTTSSRRHTIYRLVGSTLVSADD